MQNITVVGIYAPCALISAVIFVIELRRRFKRREDQMFLWLCFCAIGWSAANITSLLSANAESARFFFNFALAFVGFIPPFLLLFTLSFYKVPYKPSKTVMFLLFVVPVINTVVAVTSNAHSLMSEWLEVISLAPFREYSFEWGPWFWVHTAYSYAISLTQISVILIRHFSLPRFYRLPSSLMVTGVALTLVGNVITLLKLLPQAVDPTLVTMSLSLILFHLAIINNNKSKFVRFSYGQIYHYLNLYILAMDENSRVADYNRPAFDWFSSRGIALGSRPIDDVMESLANLARSVKDNGEGVDYYIGGDDFPVVLNQQTHELKDAKGDIIGSIAVFTDVTQNRMLIERLEKKAGMDSLTGLANHMAYDGTKKRLDTAQYYPLSVVMCDVNGLKEVNDKLGHQYGDMLLRIVAEVLERMCPPGCFVARTGGDEFIYLLPSMGVDAATLLIVRIRNELEQLRNLPFKTSVALGAATKMSEKENLDDIIALADSRMYSDKKRAKKLLAS